MSERNAGEQGAGTGWYYVASGARRGPVPTRELLELVARGELDRSALVWRKGRSDWTPIHQVESLRRQLPPTLPSERTSQAGPDRSSSPDPNLTRGQTRAPQQDREHSGASATDRKRRNMVVGFLVVAFAVAALTYAGLVDGQTEALSFAQLDGLPPVGNQSAIALDTVPPSESSHDTRQGGPLRDEGGGERPQTNQQTSRSSTGSARSSGTTLSLLRLQEVGKLRVLAPGRLTSQPLTREDITPHSAVDGGVVYQRMGDEVGVAVSHLTLAPGATYDIERGFEGAVSEMSGLLGEPLALRPQETTVSGRRALVGKRDNVQIEDTEFDVRALIVSEVPNVWIVVVLSLPSSDARADSVLASIELAR